MFTQGHGQGPPTGIPTRRENLMFLSNMPFKESSKTWRGKNCLKSGFGVSFLHIQRTLKSDSKFILKLLPHLYIYMEHLACYIMNAQICDGTNYTVPLQISKFVWHNIYIYMGASREKGR